jgi:hypothetical protein
VLCDVGLFTLGVIIVVVWVHCQQRFLLQEQATTNMMIISTFFIVYNLAQFTKLYL